MYNETAEFWMTSFRDHSRRAAHYSRMSRLSYSLNDVLRAEAEQREAAMEYKHSRIARHNYHNAMKGE